MTYKRDITRRKALQGIGGAVGAGLAVGTAAGQSGDENQGKRPIIFVHGFAGSATQFESNAMRFSSNGYPNDYLHVFEYNSLSYPANRKQVISNLNAKIDEIISSTDADKVDAMGHSLGTDVMQRYLSNSDRASKVANYVNIDGTSGNSRPGGVRTLAIWGFGNQDANFGGDVQNVHFDNQTHVQVATSEEMFNVVYTFLTGNSPDTTKIVQEDGEITIEGRGQQFLLNQPIANTTLEIYEINPDTGERLSNLASPDVDEEGYWGPVDIPGDAYLEFVATQTNTDQMHHFYRFPQMRSNRFVRLLSSNPGRGLDRLIRKDGNHAAFILPRDKEYWGNVEGSNDKLSVDGNNIINANTAPRGQNIIAPLAFDTFPQGRSNTNRPLGRFRVTPFLTGVDLYVPASNPPDGSVTVEETPRDGNGLTRTMNVQNWASDPHRITVRFPDHTQVRDDIDGGDGIDIGDGGEGNNSGLFDFL
ncbi:MAG: hypothetical protein SXQ77_12650 [Halobacteria archaeon]|nr:hypothetical protein [Halobacteria archaeon]